MECGVTVIDLAAKRAEKTPHLEGKARCIACQHEWEHCVPKVRRAVGGLPGMQP